MGSFRCLGLHKGQVDGELPLRGAAKKERGIAWVAPAARGCIEREDGWEASAARGCQEREGNWVGSLRCAGLHKEGRWVGSFRCAGLHRGQVDGELPLRGAAKKELRGAA